MALDFTTLYVVIMLNSLLMLIVWSAIYRGYERLEAAGIWALACATLLAGGLTLAMESLTGSLVPIYIGNLLVVLAFCLYWAGIRRFAGAPQPWIAILAILATMAAVLPWITFVQPNYNARNVVYAVAQSTPLALAIADLVRLPDRRVGVGIAVAGMALAIFGHGVETIGNLLQIAGLIERETYGIIEPAVVLVVIFSGVLWNFGLVLTVLDRLYTALHHRAVHDELTGLPNRRVLAERFDVERAAAEASGRPLSLLIIDLDGFKTLNDEHGHSAGDAGICHVAATASSRLRPGDIMARTGGDEFCVLLPGTGEEEACTMASVLGGAVRDTPLLCQEASLPLTLSIGVAQWRSGQSLDVLTRVADAALYEAKARGRDRYILRSAADEAAPQAAAPRIADA